MVQEIVNGFGNLFDFLHKKNARLTYWQCAQIALGISDAMAYCKLTNAHECARMCMLAYVFM